MFCFCDVVVVVFVVVVAVVLFSFFSFSLVYVPLSIWNLFSVYIKHGSFWEKKGPTIDSQTCFLRSATRAKRLFEENRPKSPFPLFVIFGQFLACGHELEEIDFHFIKPSFFFRFFHPLFLYLRTGGACKSSPCFHGTCRELGLDDYHCVCNGGFTGHNCEKG